MREYGLIGYPLGHSFSARYFSAKFAREGLADCSYQLFELPSIKNLPQLLQEHQNLCGLNVTIPHKQSVLPYLDSLDPVAEKIGAVNTIKVEADKTLTGYNTDWLGFRDALLAFVGETNLPHRALILGSGGSSLAVKAALESLGISHLTVSRERKEGAITYQELSEEQIAKHRLIVNTTPLGMYPETASCPDIPYQKLSSQHYLFDLVYNPAETLFMKKGKAAGAKVCNGLHMLELQAEAAWKIWQS